MVAILLLFVGFFLIFLEFFLPGGVMGTAGALFVITSIIVFAFSGYSAFLTLMFAVGAIAGLIVVIRFSLARVKKSSPESGLYENNDQAGFYASTYDREAVGEEGRALSDLKPSGHIVVHNKRYQAVSERGYINKDANIVVVGGRGGYLIVKHKEKKGELS